MTNIQMHQQLEKNFLIQNFYYRTFAIILISKMQHQQKLGTFINKLQYLLNRQEYTQIICWDKTKTIINIISQEKMQQQIIPIYFRHQKYESFVRQLNLYGFKKIKSNGKHSFTHRQLLIGQGLESITAHKTSQHYKNKAKDVISDSSSQKIIDSQKSLENQQGYIKTGNEFNNKPILPALVLQESKNNYLDVSLTPQLQTISSFFNPYLNYWNIFSMEQPNQFSTLIFISPIQNYQQ